MILIASDLRWENICLTVKKTSASQVQVDPNKMRAGKVWNYLMGYIFLWSHHGWQAPLCHAEYRHKMCIVFVWKASEIHTEKCGQEEYETILRVINFCYLTMDDKPLSSMQSMGGIKCIVFVWKPVKSPLKQVSPACLNCYIYLISGAVERWKVTQYNVLASRCHTDGVYLSCQPIHWIYIEYWFIFRALDSWKL